jgi:L-alanine-DL-glutamate epimerase-like enolase superfamily enzyme
MKNHKNHQINRRGFFRHLGAGLTGGALGSGLLQFRNSFLYASDISEIKIKRISRYTLGSKRWKVVGKNSRDGVHGKDAKDRILRIETDAGLEGVGISCINKEQAAPLLGKDPLSFYKVGIGIVSPLEEDDGPLWDLAGKIYGQPVWQLIGGYGPEWIPVYDGSIYFSDLEHEYRGKEIDRILFEVEYSLNLGHRAFKIKIGRGAKWMEKEPGFKRDVDVVKAIRKRVGPDIKLMVDANNGYDLATTKHFLEEVGGEVFFIEEMFPENLDKYIELKNWMRKHGFSTLLADGENAKEIDDFDSYFDQQALDVYQADMRRSGFTNLVKISQKTTKLNIKIAPHNWGSYLGFYMQLTLGRGIPNFLMAEQDPLDTEMVDTTGFEFKNGKVYVPNTPGGGISFKKEFFDNSANKNWEIS